MVTYLTLRSKSGWLGWTSSFVSFRKVTCSSVSVLVLPGVRVRLNSHPRIAKKYAPVIRSAVCSATSPIPRVDRMTSFRRSGVAAACLFGGGSLAAKAVSSRLRVSDNPPVP